MTPGANGEVIADFVIEDLCGYDAWLLDQDDDTRAAVSGAFRAMLEHLCNHLDGEFAHGDHRFDLGPIVLEGRARFNSRALDDGPLTLVLAGLQA